MILRTLRHDAIVSLGGETLVLLRFSPGALARSHFAISPLAETVGALIVLERGQPADPRLTSWYARHHERYSRTIGEEPFDRNVARLLGSTRWVPTFVAIPPTGGMMTELADELAVVASVSDEEMRSEIDLSIRNSWLDHTTDWLVGSSWGTRVAALLERVWHEHVGGEWARRRALLERDITFRTSLIAAQGWPGAVHRMSRHSEWVGEDTITVGNRDAPDRVVGAGGMQFVPISAATGSWLCLAEPSRHALVYPARGAVDGPLRRPRKALERLIGSARAVILSELAVPATTSELAAGLGFSLGAVGGHLGVLREAGLVVGHRVGRRVVYHRTSAAEALVAPDALGTG